jgi:hypothetical protein
MYRIKLRRWKDRLCFSRKQAVDVKKTIPWIGKETWSVNKFNLRFGITVGDVKGRYYHLKA